MTIPEALMFSTFHCVLCCTFWSLARKASPALFRAFDCWCDRWAERLLAAGPILLLASVLFDWPPSLRAVAAGVFAFSLVNAIQTYRRVMRSG